MVLMMQIIDRLEYQDFTNHNKEDNMKSKKGSVSVLTLAVIAFGICAMFGKPIADKNHEFLSNGLNDSHKKTIVFYSDATEEQKAEMRKNDPNGFDNEK